MADGQQRNLERLRVDSDALLSKLSEMKHAEEEKRGEDVSTPEFHRLGEDVARLSREAFRLAEGEAETGESTTTTDRSIDEVPNERA